MASICPIFVLGDDAFPLLRRMMKPFSPHAKQKLSDEEIIFNYRISRGRRIVENAFGLLQTKWACVGRTLHCTPDHAKKIERMKEKSAYMYVLVRYFIILFRYFL